jgi:signal transduction histidine kinase
MSANFTKEAILHSSPSLALNELDEMLPIMEKALHQVRTLLFDLRPVILETQGLIPALMSYAARLREQEGLDVELNVTGELGRLSHKAEVAVFSVVQEAINNSKKHADASRIHIDVTVTPDDFLVVEVHDNGVGFDVDSVVNTYDERGSLGMLNMRERAEVVDGNLSVSSQPGQGTKITLRFPLAPHRS